MKLFLAIVLVLFLSIQSSSAYAAAKKTPQGGGTISVNATHNKIKKSVPVTFGNLSNVKKVTYTLIYEGNGIGQGVSGSFSPGKSKSISRNLLLGTCSKNVCTYHRNVKNIQLEVKTTYKTNKSTTKMYNIK